MTSGTLLSRSTLIWNFSQTTPCLLRNGRSTKKSGRSYERPLLSIFELKLASMLLSGNGTRARSSSTGPMGGSRCGWKFLSAFALAAAPHRAGRHWLAHPGRAAWGGLRTRDAEFQPFSPRCSVFFIYDLHVISRRLISLQSVFHEILPALLIMTRLSHALEVDRPPIKDPRRIVSQSAYVDFQNIEAPDGSRQRPPRPHVNLTDQLFENPAGCPADHRI